MTENFWPAPTPDESPSDAPDWAFSPDHELKCPECASVCTGLNWVMTGEGDQTKATGMLLLPCRDELSMSDWELAFSGRDRKLGTVIRTPRFQRKGD